MWSALKRQMLINQFLLKSPDEGDKIPIVSSQPKMPVLNRQRRSYNCEECAFQASGGGSSKALLKHSKDSGHKTNSLEERCYNCDEVFNTFTDTGGLSILTRLTNVDTLLKAIANLSKGAGTAMKGYLTKSM